MIIGDEKTQNAPPVGLAGGAFCIIGGEKIEKAAHFTVFCAEFVASGGPIAGNGDALA